MSQIRVGTRLEMGNPDYEELSRHSKLAEKLGYDTVWARDHVSLEYVTGEESCLECWTVLSALARDTERIKIGSLVLCTPFRNPALLAKMATTLDLVSHGRLFLGIGAGHVKSEFDEYGYRFPTPGERVTMLSEAVQIIKLMWSEHRPSFEGKFFSIHQALNEPKPVQKPPAMMIGATKPRALRLVAKYADAWNSPDSIEGYQAGREILDRACEEFGRDPKTLRDIVSLPIIVDRSEAEAKKRHQRVLEHRTGQPYLAHRIVAGTPEQVAERYRPLLELGVHEFITTYGAS